MYYDRNPSDKVKLAFKEFVVEKFQPGDFDLTLTFRLPPWQLPSNYTPNIEFYSAQIAHYLNVVNFKFLGGKSKRGMRLRTINVFELNYSDGVHCHMLLENPETDRVPVDGRPALLLELWAKTKSCGDIRGNLVRTCDDPAEWTNYIFKRIDKNNVDFTDIHNWH